MRSGYARQGFSPGAVSYRLWQFDRLSGWLEQEALAPSGLTEARAREFVERDEAAGVVHAKSPRTLRLPLVYLREVGAVPAPVPRRGPHELLLDGFGDYLAREEQLSRVVDEKVKHQAATFSSVVVVSSSVTLMPSLNFTPASTSVTSSWPLNRRQRSWAASSSL